ncbi:MAG: O-antigen ligase family protein [Armatimonadetes bacterium]|nr:O-antigen ligase family protein [Armatimonadota bacterium]
MSLGAYALLVWAGVGVLWWLVAHPHWAAPFVMFCAVAVPTGYPFELKFRLGTPVLALSILEVSILLGLAACLLARSFGGRRTHPSLRPGARWAVGLLFAMFLVGVLVGVARGQTTENIVRDIRVLFLYTAFFLAVPFDSRRQLGRLANVLVAGMTLISCLQIAVSASPSLQEFFAAERGRVWFGNGVLYVLALPLALALAGTTHRKTRTLLWASCACLMLVGLALSLTRAHWLASATSLAVMGLLVVARRGRMRVHIARVSVGLAVAIVAALSLSVASVGTARMEMALSDVWSRVGSLGEMSSDSSLATRAYNIDAVNKQIASDPIIGTGAGTTMVLRSGEGVVYSSDAQYVDNVPQTLLVKYGVLGAIPFVWFWLLAAGAAWRLRRSGSALGAAYAAAVPGLGVLCLMSSFLIAGPQVAALVLIAGVFLRTQWRQSGWWRKEADA